MISSVSRTYCYIVYPMGKLKLFQSASESSTTQNSHTFKTYHTHRFLIDTYTLASVGIDINSVAFLLGTLSYN